MVRIGQAKWHVRKGIQIMALNVDVELTPTQLIGRQQMQIYYGNLSLLAQSGMEQFGLDIAETEELSALVSMVMETRSLSIYQAQATLMNGWTGLGSTSLTNEQHLDGLAKLMELHPGIVSARFDRRPNRLTRLIAVLVKPED